MIKSATLLIVIVLGSMQAIASEGYLLFNPGTLEAKLGGDFRYSDANFESGGSQTGLPHDGTYQIFEFDFSSRYTFSPSWAMFAEAGMGYAESKGYDADRSGMAFTHGQFGVDWNLGISEFITVIPRFSYLFPFEKISADQDDVINSEGVDETLLGVQAQTAFEGFRMYGSLGYKMRGDGRSHLLPWSLGVEFPLRTWLWGARLMGYESISDDKDAGSANGESARQTTVDRVNGGSLKFYSVNPSLVDSEAYMTFAFGKGFQMGLKAGLTLTGSNNAFEYHGGGFLLYRFTPAPVRSSLPQRPKEERLSIDPYVDQFKEDTSDGVDQNLFRAKPKPMPRQQPSQPRGTDLRILRERQRRLRAQEKNQIIDLETKREREEMRRLKKQLDDAEMTIELKKGK